MGQKQDKKVRQMFRREIRDHIKELNEQHFKDGPVFKLKPKYVPQWLWDKLVYNLMDEGFLVRYSLYKKQQNENGNTTSE